MAQIKFGTSGWRGILADEFTLDNVRVVIQAVADHLRDEGIAGQGVVVGYDARFMGRDFARETVRILAGAGIKAFMCERDTPTPVISHELIRRKAAGAINFTASHNPYEYNGIKFSPAWGGPALPETTKDIEKRANAMIGEIVHKGMPLNEADEKGLFEVIDPREEYFNTMRGLIDLDAIAKSGVRLAVNTLYGSGRGYLDQLLKDAGVDVKVINDFPDPYFGGEPPEPAESHMPEFIEMVKSDDSISLGIATDGDADRFGIVDGDGSYIEPNYILALLFDYMIRKKGMKGDASRSVATSQLIDAVAAHYGVNVLETPVGFKYIGEYISQDRILIGGEESAGMTVKGHVPEKDGILACLMVAEMVAVEGRSLRELLADLYARVGEHFTKRVNLKLGGDVVSGLDEKFAGAPAAFGAYKVIDTVTMDGYKYLFGDGAWLLFRKSGTEPVVRLYAEAKSEKVLDEIVALGKKFILS